MLLESTRPAISKRRAELALLNPGQFQTRNTIVAKKFKVMLTGKARKKSKLSNKFRTLHGASAVCWLTGAKVPWRHACLPANCGPVCSVPPQNRLGVKRWQLPDAREAKEKLCLMRWWVYNMTLLVFGAQLDQLSRVRSSQHVCVFVYD